MAIVVLAAPGRPDLPPIPTCTVHLMGPCPCRECGGAGSEFEQRVGFDVQCPRCDGDGCDPDVREDCEAPR